MGVIIHFSLLKSIFSVKAISNHLLIVQFKITGGRFSVFGIYAPHNDVEVAAREEFYQELTECVTECKREGPVAAVGDFNTRFKYRLPEEHAAFGPFLFDPGGAEVEAPIPDCDISNRDLLALCCLSTGFCVANTFLRKPLMQQLTLFDRRLSDWNTEVFDGRWHQQLDLMLISTEYRSCVHDIVSRRSVRIGPTTHYLQVATVMMPIQ